MSSFVSYRKELWVLFRKVGKNSVCLKAGFYNNQLLHKKIIQYYDDLIINNLHPFYNKTIVFILSGQFGNSDSTISFPTKAQYTHHGIYVCTSAV